MTDMRHYIDLLTGLFETTYNTLMDEEIEKYIESQTRDMGFSKPATEVIWDIILVVKAADERGATDEEVTEAFLAMYPDKNPKWAISMLRKLGDVVQKVGDRWHWMADLTLQETMVFEDDDDDSDIDPMTRQAISMQLNLTYQVLDMVKDLGTFTMAELVGQLHQMGLPEPMASEFAEHFVSQFPKTIIRTGDSFEYREEKPKNAMDTLRGLLDTPPQ